MCCSADQPRLAKLPCAPTRCRTLLYTLQPSTFLLFCCTGGETRTPDTRFWRPVLYQLSYTYILGGPCRTRTCNLLLRRQLLYPVELRNHNALSAREFYRKLNYIVLYLVILKWTFCYRIVCKDISH